MFVSIFPLLSFSTGGLAKSTISDNLDTSSAGDYIYPNNLDANGDTPRPTSVYGFDASYDLNSLKAPTPSNDWWKDADGDVYSVNIKGLTWGTWTWQNQYHEISAHYEEHKGMEVHRIEIEFNSRFWAKESGREAWLHIGHFNSDGTISWEDVPFYIAPDNAFHTYEIGSDASSASNYYRLADSNLRNYINPETGAVHLRYFAKTRGGTFDVGQIIMEVDVCTVKITYKGVEDNEGHYPAPFSFENDVLGSVPTGWQATTYPSTSADIVDMVDGHSKVLRLSKSGSQTDHSTWQSFGNQVYGEVEFWLRTMSESTTAWGLRGSNLWGVIINMYGGYFGYHDGTGWYQTGVAAQINKWYHVKFQFECGTSGHYGLGQYRWRLYVDGNLAGEFSFSNNVGSLSEFRMYTNWRYTFMTSYVDAVGYSWLRKYDFESDFIGSVPAGWQATEYPATSAEVVDLGGDRHNVLMISKSNSQADHSTYQIFESQTFGEVEFWLRTTSDTTAWGLRGSNSWGFLINTNGGVFGYWDESGLHYTGVAAQLNKWYHVKFQFECETGGHYGLGQYRWRLYIDGNLVGMFSFLNNMSSLNEFRMYTNWRYKYMTSYVDDVEYSWGVYNIGDNRNKFSGIPSINLANGFSDGAVVRGSVNLDIRVSDDVGVSLVEIHDNDNLIHSERRSLTSASWTYNYQWDTTQLSDGGHEIKVVAYDGSGRKSQTSCMLTVDNVAELIGGLFWEVSTTTGVEYYVGLLDIGGFDAIYGQGNPNPAELNFHFNKVLAREGDLDTVLLFFGGTGGPNIDLGPSYITSYDARIQSLDAEKKLIVVDSGYANTGGSMGWITHFQGSDVMVVTSSNDSPSLRNHFACNFFECIGSSMYDNAQEIYAAARELTIIDYQIHYRLFQEFYFVEIMSTGNLASLVLND